MSKAQDLCYESLRMVLLPSVKVIPNYRPDILKNPKTGRNLELDFYLPASNVGIEVQGNHHLDDEDQQWRDEFNRKRCQEVGILLVELCLTQVDPVRIKNKLLALSYASGRYIGIGRFTPAFLEMKTRVQEYARSLRKNYPESPVNFQCGFQRRLMGTRRYRYGVEETRVKKRKEADS